ncbi:MAG TPA: hypothetical protein VKH43_08830 [Thermoanaerobaculia bacterium]|nr:hypothetical protein [Thermoanaerobaculia bacterium]
MRKALACAAAAIAILGWTRAAAAQEACKTTKLEPPALTLSKTYAMAEKHAKAWKKDAVPARLGNTSLGPLKADGSSTAWNFQFFSESANATVMINTFRGSLTCWAQPGPAGRIPDLKADFFRDGAKLYGVAKEKGGEYIDKGYAVMIQTAAAPSDRHATWYINFSQEGGKDAPLSVILDANTGAVESVLTH